MRQAREQVFLLDSDWPFCKAVADYFATEGYAVRTMTGPEDAIRHSSVEPPALVLLGVTADQRQEQSLPKILRKNEHLKKTPLVWIGGQASTMERYEALEAGADDYISKPVSPRELLARVRDVLRRKSADRSLPPISIGALEIDREGMTASLEGRPIPVTLFEFRVLEYLAQDPGQAFSRRELLAATGGAGQLVTPRSVDTLVWRLRKKMKLTPRTPTYLHTIRRFGYSLFPGASN